jgi:hypothetical protein
MALMPPERTGRRGICCCADPLASRTVVAPSYIPMNLLSMRQNGSEDGNQNPSPEEVECIADIVDSLMQSSVEWIDDKRQSRPLGWDDVLIVSPYNAQVSDLWKRLPKARVGTVDKFQGQQAPVVICSMATSSPEDAPRGMEFLYSLNRLNVATSRAQAMVIVVGNSRLLEPECRSPRQMQVSKRSVPLRRNGSGCRSATMTIRD